MNPELTPQDPAPQNPPPQDPVPPNPYPQNAILQNPVTQNPYSALFAPPHPEPMDPHEPDPLAEFSRPVLSAAEQKSRRKAEKRKVKNARRLENYARSQRWKEKKREHHQQLKEYYQDAPWIVRVSRLYLLKPFLIMNAVLLALILAASTVAGAIFLGMELIEDSFIAGMDDPVDPELIYEQSPLDEEGAAAIRALPSGDPSQTWGIYIYMVGSDLEDYDMSVLSDLTIVQASAVSEALYQESLDRRQDRLERYQKNLELHGLTMPEFLYYPKSEAVSVYGYSDDVYYEDTSDEIGFASLDIEEMLSEPLADNITLVMQTGGSCKWSNPMINPNKLQRFCIHNGEMKEEANMPLKPSSDPEVLADFLRYCKEEHPADHTMVILWDHGGGVFGYGVDSIFGSCMSLSDLRSAFSLACDPDQNDPPFDIIGFDACLMGNLEVTHTLNGFADYYLLSEENEPAGGWDYEGFLQQLSEKPEMHPAKLCQIVADTYTDYYITQNINISMLGISRDVTFSVIDARKSAALYDAYSLLAQKQLIDAAKDISVLAEIGRAGAQSTHYSAFAYNYYNLIDLGNYVDYLVDSYPEESSRIKNLLNEAVLYHRENGSMSDSQGLTIYLPASIEDLSGTLKCLEYIDSITEDPATQALYYYKLAGCLTPEMKRYVRTLTANVPKTLNTKLFSDFTRMTPVIEEDHFSIPVDSDLQSMIQSSSFCISQYLEDEDVIVSYGGDEYAYLDGDGNITSSEFDGSWIYLEDVLLEAELINATSSSVEYRAKVLKDGSPVYLMFTYDRDSEEFTVNGTKPILTDESGDAWMINNKTEANSPVGCKLTPIYTEEDLYTGNRTDREGKTIKFRESSEITMKPLPDGTYLSRISIEDQRGDTYSSAILDVRISGGKIKEYTPNTQFVALAW